MKRLSARSLLPLILLAASLWSVAPAFAQQSGEEDQVSAGVVEPPDVYRMTLVVREEIERIRQAMNGPRAARSEPNVAGVSPFEVYFQATALHEKTGRLAFEQARVFGEELTLPVGSVGPADVLRVVERSLDDIRTVGDELGLEGRVTPPRRDPSKTPTDVYRSIARANRQLDSLLEEVFAPGDVYRQVTQALALAMSLRRASPGARPPETPAFTPGKSPADVLERLIECLDLIKPLARSVGVETLVLGPEKRREVKPTDVHEIASLILAQLREVHARLERPRPVEIPHPGTRTPSDVFQRAGMLLAVLVELGSAEEGLLPEETHHE